MRILFTIPHFYDAKAGASRPGATGEPPHGSELPNRDRRVRALMLTIGALHQTFGQEQAYCGRTPTACNDRIAAHIEIIICTTGDHHLVEHLPARLFRHHRTHAESLLLGYECHAVLADHLGQFDYYCFLEDDVLVSDALFFWKQTWFNRTFGDHALLQPRRFELSHEQPIHKLYIDGTLRDRQLSPRFQDTTVRPHVAGQIFGIEVNFDRVENPHAGCFFLTPAQMQRWSRQPYFLDRARDFWGPLESAATLGIMRTFEVYKPALANAGFLEVRHLDNRYLGRQLRLPPSFTLRSPAGESAGFDNSSSWKSIAPGIDDQRRE